MKRTLCQRITAANHTHNSSIATDNITEPKRGKAWFPETHNLPVHKTSLHHKLIKLSLANAALFIVELFLCFEQNQRYYSNGYKEDSITDGLRVACILLSVVEMAFVIRRKRLTQAYFTERDAKNLAKNWDWILTLEIFTHLLVLPPRVNKETIFYLLGTYSIMSLSDFAFLCAMLRLYHLPVLAFWISNCTTTRASFHWYSAISRIQGVKSPLSWVLRGTFKSISVFHLFAVWLIAGLAAGLCINVVEHGVPESVFSDPWNSIWCGFVGEATIGYGDVSPKTHLGRIFIVLAVLGGMMLLSSTVMKSRVGLELNFKQRLLYRQICYKHVGFNYLRTVGATLIQRWWKLMQARKRAESRWHLLNKFNRLLSTFLRRKRKVESLKHISFQEDLIRIGKTTHAWVTQFQEHFKEIEEIDSTVKVIQAYRMMTTEFSLMNKTKSISTWCKTRLQVILGKGIRRPSQPRFALEADRASRSSNRSRNTAKLKMLRQKARDSALRKLRRKIQGDTSPITPLSNREFTAAMMSRDSSGAIEPYSGTDKDEDEERKAMSMR